MSICQSDALSVLLVLFLGIFGLPKICLTAFDSRSRSYGPVSKDQLNHPEPGQATKTAKKGLVPFDVNDTCFLPFAMTVFWLSCKRVGSDLGIISLEFYNI